MLSSFQAYTAMFYFLENYYFATKHDTLGSMLGFMSTEIFSGGTPIDAAVLCDWEDSVKKVTGESILSAEQVRQSAIEFLKFYHSKFGYDVNCIIEKLKMVSIQDLDWTSCINKAKQSCSK